MFSRLRALAAGALFALSACATAPAPADADLYYNLTLLDPVNETRTAHAYLLVADGRIVDTGTGRLPAVTPERRHDMAGAFALPGLIDTHAHVTLGRIVVRMENGAPVLVATSEDDITTHNARLLIAHGVTTIRNPGGDSEANARYARNVASGEWLGPTALQAGEILDRSRFDGLSVLVTDDASIETAVAHQAALGMQYVKLYHLLDETQIAAGVAAARRRHMRTVIHSGEVSWTRAAELGVESIVHGMPISPDLLPASTREGYQGAEVTGARAFYQWWERADLDAPEMREMIRTLAQRRISVDLTLVVFQKAFWGDDASVRDAGLEYTAAPMPAEWRRFRFDIGWTADDYSRARVVWPKILRFARMLDEAGVPLTIGTDLANPWVSPGYDLHTEMMLYGEAGIAPWRVLRMATSGAADTMRLDRVGRLAPGYEADIVFVDRDPSRDVANIRSVSSVVIDGRRFESTALIAGSPD